MGDNQPDGGASVPPSFSKDDESVDHLTYPHEAEPPHREKLRGTIAIWFLSIFSLEVVAILFCLLCFPDRLNIIKDIATVLVTPTLTLLGAVTGFYYGVSGK